MAELENVMQRLDAQTRQLKERIVAPRESPRDGDLTVEALALVSEAVLKIGRDIRALRLQFADR